MPPETGISGAAAGVEIVEVGARVGVLVGVGVKVDVGVIGLPIWVVVGLGVGVEEGVGILVAVGFIVGCIVGETAAIIAEEVPVDTSLSVLGTMFVIVNDVEQVGVKALLSAGVGLLVSRSSRAVDKASIPKLIQETTRNIITKLFFIKRINFIYF